MPLSFSQGFINIVIMKKTFSFLLLPEIDEALDVFLFWLNAGQ